MRALALDSERVRANTAYFAEQHGHSVCAYAKDLAENVKKGFVRTGSNFVSEIEREEGLQQRMRRTTVVRLLLSPNLCAFQAF